MYDEPKITFMCVTYNRVKMLNNLLLSFVMTNTYKNFEWIILEHDCTDGTAEYLDNILDNPLFDELKGKLKVIHSKDQPYLEFLENCGKDIDLRTTKKRVFSQFGKYRNDIIKESTGDIIIDIPDDHQFLYKGAWCEEIIDIFNDRIEKTGKNDVSVLSFRTRMGYRIDKPNNCRTKVQTTKSGVEYYVIKSTKTHDEWCAFSKENFKKAGLFPQLENMPRDIIDKWNNYKDFYYLHHEYLNEKFFELNLKRITTKLPITHDCDNSSWEKYAKPNKTIFKIRESKEDFKIAYKKHTRPISTEEFEKQFPPGGGSIFPGSDLYFLPDPDIT